MQNVLTIVLQLDQGDEPDHIHINAKDVNLFVCREILRALGIWRA